MTDLSMDQILSLTCAYQQIPEESQTYLNLMDKDYITIDKEGIMWPKSDKIVDALK